MAQGPYVFFFCLFFSFVFTICFIEKLIFKDNFIQTVKRGVNVVLLMFYREKLEQRGPLEKLDLLDLRDLLESPVLRDCVVSLALL